MIPKSDKYDGTRRSVLETCGDAQHGWTGNFGSVAR